MADVTLITDCGPLCTDVAINCGYLVQGNDLQNAILISLFTDARDPLRPDETGNPRGWWGDDAIGSRIWTLDHAIQLPETLRLAEDYAKEALAWLNKDGVAASVSVAASYEGCYLVLDIGICRPNGTTQRWRHRYAWDNFTVTTQCLSPGPQSAS